MKNILIPNQESLDETVRRLIEGGVENLHVVSDFDRTLTRAFVRGVKSPTVIAQIRNGNYLTPDYASRAHALFDIYHPIEINPNISHEEKNRKMHEWWKLHFELLVECGLTRGVIKEIIRKRSLKFRKGTLDFLDLLHRREIPLVIMSAGPGDMIKEYLRQEGKLYDDFYVVANFLEFDENGKVIRVQEPIIHSCNKHEIEVKRFSFYKQFQKRKNVLLLGDDIEDLGMVEGFPYETLLNVGFYNEKPEDPNYEKGLEQFKERFDVVVLNDGDMGYVNGLIKRVR
ncbi:haloacid dehalogenase-like hydrolase [Candidatus Pacearchaeota archaeon]|nr:haloacid dehalogenase-like hydrolase [Candidatus Pacearchaeota archaeon]